MLALANESAWCDEALSAACLPAAGFRDYLQCAFERDPTIRLAPLYHVVQFTWSQLFGGSLYSLRMLSISLSVVAMCQLYFLSRSFIAVTAARWAVLLFGMSLFQVYYGQEVRVYALLNVLALASMQGLLAYSEGKNRSLWMALLFNAGLLLTHSFTVVFLLAQGFIILLIAQSRRSALCWIGAHAGLAVAFAAWILMLGYDLGRESTAFVGAPAGIRELAATVLQFAGARFSNRNPGAYLPGGWNAEFIVLALVTLLALLPLVTLIERKSEDAQRRRFIVCLILWLVVPVVLLFVVGRLWRPCFYPRYLIYSAIPVNLLAAAGLASVRPAVIRHGCCALLLVMLLWQNLALPRPFRADYGAVTRALENDDAPEKAVLALKRFNFLAVDYALRDHNVEVELLHGLKETIGIAHERAGQGKSVWVVFYLWSELEAFEDAMLEAGLMTRSFESAGMPPLTIYHVERAR